MEESLADMFGPAAVTEMEPAAEPQPAADQPAAETSPAVEPSASEVPAAETPAADPNATYSVTLVPDQYDTLVQAPATAYQTEVHITFLNIFLGLIIGYILVKGMTSPWK